MSGELFVLLPMKWKETNWNEMKWNEMKWKEMKWKKNKVKLKYEGTYR